MRRCTAEDAEERNGHKYRGGSRCHGHSVHQSLEAPNRLARAAAQEHEADEQQRAGRSRDGNHGVTEILEDAQFDRAEDPDPATNIAPGIHELCFRAGERVIVEMRT